MSRPKVERLADLKRIPVGTKLRLVRCLMGAVPADKQAREVKRVQSNAIEFYVGWSGLLGGERPSSWLHFPKAVDFHATADGFTVTEHCGDKFEVAAAYVFVDDGGAQ